MNIVFSINKTIGYQVDDFIGGRFHDRFFILLFIQIICIAMFGILSINMIIVFGIISTSSSVYWLSLVGFPFSILNSVYAVHGCETTGFHLSYIIDQSNFY